MTADNDDRQMGSSASSLTLTALVPVNLVMI